MLRKRVRPKMGDSGIVELKAVKPVWHVESGMYWWGKGNKM